MEINKLYEFVLIIILVAFVVGIGVLSIDKFATVAASSSVNSDATVTVLNASRDAVGEIATSWMSLIVTIGVLALIIGLIVGGFVVYQKR